jgi:hypothetical protein
MTAAGEEEQTARPVGAVSKSFCRRVGVTVIKQKLGLETETYLCLYKYIVLVYTQHSSHKGKTRLLHKSK